MTMDGRILFLLVLLPFLGSAITGLFRRADRSGSAWFTAAIALVAFVATASIYPIVSGGKILHGTLEWLPAYGLNVTLRMDGFAWLFAMLITGIGLLVVIYARYYMSPEDPVPRFFSFLLGFMGSMLGIVLSGNIVLLAVFWELTSVFSFLLIGYWYHNASARDGARMVLTVTGIGGFCLLAGVLLLGHVVGSYDLDRVLAAGDLVRAHPLYTVILVLIALAAFTKSAQFPFHFWLPNAMAAPTPVSAYLHSATMVKAGVFLLARLWPVLAGTEEWFWILGGGRAYQPADRQFFCGVPAGFERATCLFDHQQSWPHHSSFEPWKPACGGGCNLPHGQSCNLQGVAFHGGRHYRP